MLISWVRATTSHCNYPKKKDTMTTNICMLLQSLSFPLCNRAMSIKEHNYLIQFFFLKENLKHSFGMLRQLQTSLGPFDVPQFCCHWLPSLFKRCRYFWLLTSLKSWNISLEIVWLLPAILIIPDMKSCLSVMLFSVQIGFLIQPSFHTCKWLLILGRYT